MFKKGKKGGITKHFKNVAKGGEHGTTKRTAFPGGYGYGSLNTLHEQIAIDESRIFSDSQDMEGLIKELFIKEKQDETQ
jgi:hypothetical protein